MDAEVGRTPSDVSCVVIAHRDPGTRFGARLALQEQGFRVVGDGATTAEAVQLVRRLHPAACVMDMGLSGALAAIRTIARAHPPCATVALGGSKAHADVLAAFRSGASGYLGTDIEPTCLPDTLRGILAGEAVMPAATFEWVMTVLQNGDPPDDNRALTGGRGLTERHWQVLALAERRLTTAEIARELGVSPVTVRRHRAEIRSRRPLTEGTDWSAANGAGQT
jgi:two-component system, NarL family, nitrate/nitrite response regulator NarL